MPNSQSAQTDELIRVQIPSWNKLFGQNSQCECHECASMTGAPAYLAHILHFTENSKTNFNKETAYDILIKRVPYLPHLPLTCQNTNTEMSYVQIVLEMLVFFAAKNTLDGMPAYDSGSQDWEAAYQAASKKAYKILNTQSYPFSLPYHQPLDLIRTYLSKVKTTIPELLQTFNYSANNELWLLKEGLLLSEEEYLLLTQFKIGNLPVEVFTLYGFTALQNFKDAIFGARGVSEFLSNTGLLYTELIDILKTQFVNPATRSVNFIQDLFARSTVDMGVIYTSLTEIKNAPLDASFDTVLKIKIINLLLKSSNPDLDPQLFKTWMDNNFDQFKNTIVIIPSLEDPCNYANAKLGTIDGSYNATITIPISDDQFKRLYFFIRLYKKTTQTINELDILLFSVAEKPREEIIKQLYLSQNLMQKFSITVGRAISFNGNIDSVDPTSSFASLFLNSSINGINEAFRPDVFGDYFSIPVSLKVGNIYNPVLLKAFQWLPGQMDDLVHYLGITDPTTVNLSLEMISVLYSYKVLSAMLSISITDLLQLIKAFGKPAVLRNRDAVTSKFIDANIWDTLAFIQFIETITSACFSVSELLFILNISEQATISDQVSDENIKKVLISLQQSMAKIDFENPVPKDQELNEVFVKNKLLQVYNKDIVAELAGMLNGSIVYGLNLQPAPDLIIPDALKYKISYDKNSGRLVVKGVLTKADWDIVPANGGLQLALQPIFDKPFNFIKNNFSVFIVSDNDGNNLLERVNIQPVSTGAKLKIFYTLFMPYLTRQLKESVIIQQVASLILLSEPLTRVISRSVIDDLYHSIIAIVADISVITNYFPQAKIAAFKTMVISLFRAAVYITRFGLNLGEVTHFINDSANFSLINFTNFSVQQWERINNYCCLRKLSKSAEFSLIALFKLDVATLPMEIIINYIIAITAWQKDDLLAIIDKYSFTSNDFKNEQALYRISNMMELVNKTSIKANQLAEWAATDARFDSLATLSTTVKSTILDRYVPSERTGTEEKISADLLERQRNALVAYILSMDEIKKNGIRNSDELCGYFLIDIPMSSSMKTTRIRQAISTVQSYCKRCLMGLESVKNQQNKEVGIAPEYIDNSVWEPKSFFRTWQVTMQFLTNPYPYLSYKYLIDKSGAAKKLEATLLKSNIIQREVEDAYRTYLQELSESANLEIAAMYIDDSINVDNNSSSKFIHVIGKTRSGPHTYYYCTKNESGRWSFWEKIPVAIKENDADRNGPSGAHIFFTKIRSRYYLFMPEFVIRAESKSYGKETPVSQSKQATNLLITPPFWEIKMAVSEYFQGKWGDKQYLKSSGDLTVFNLINKDISSYLFTYEVSKDGDGKDQLIISLVDNSGNKILAFTFKSVHSALFTGKGSGYIIKPPQGVFYQNLKMRELNYPMPANNGVEANPIPDILLETKNEKLLNFSPQYLKGLVSVYEQPFFLHDRDRSYYVKTVPIDYAVGYTHEVSGGYTWEMQSHFDANIIAIRYPDTVTFLPVHLTI